MRYELGATKKSVPCIYGLGKDFSAQEKADPIPSGTPILSRFDADGWHKFTIEEFGRAATYAVRDAQIIDDALAK